MHKTWGRAAVALSIAALALSGCGDTTEPTGSPTPKGSSSAASPSGSGSPSASASSSASPTTNASVPAEARQRTEDGAIAFLHFYFELYNKALLDPPNAPNLFAYADKDCIACKKTQDLFTEYAEGGWSVRESGVRIENAALATEATAPKVIVNFTFTEATQPLYQNGKKTTHAVPAANTKKGAALKWVNNAWQMYGVENM
ncbi:hypothetical protein N802_11225 [Knoellia sinensis KCTC 19936]|uniref:DUF6318 domain-containing protein n=1 Tax=Knoellia sinensis KCTC 19936 TaxID=1385520 RepID=A0A0A0J5Y7_9MICO|nr:DUF6318 family protein [Knoellia sinensis]KGN32194.1 hypothetical protein N802_11225 [Knoellia sinensis KCTC 19936]